mgnify:FL=1
MKVSVPSIICAVIMAGIGLVCLSISDNFIWQVVSIFICMGVYFVLYFLLFKKILLDSLQAIGLPLRKKTKL